MNAVVAARARRNAHAGGSGSVAGAAVVAAAVCAYRRACGSAVAAASW